MAKTSYEELKEAIAKKVQEAGGSRMSKSDLTQLTHTLLNTPEQEVTNYLKDVNDPVKSKPVEKYRESLKGIVKQFGVDSAELDKVQEIKIGKDHADAVNDIAMQIVKDYTATGRKLILPIQSKDESQMEISQVEKAAKSEETRKLVETEPGKYESVPTGKRKKTKAHKELKVSNKVPAWLVDVEDI